MKRLGMRIWMGVFGSRDRRSAEETPSPKEKEAISITAETPLSNRVPRRNGPVNRSVPDQESATPAKSKDRLVITQVISW